jgi:hypothetical protein
VTRTGKAWFWVWVANAIFGTVGMATSNLEAVFFALAINIQIIAAVLILRGHNE